MSYDTEPDKERYQIQLSSLDRFRLRAQDNVVKENVDFFYASRKNRDAQ